MRIDYERLAAAYAEHRWAHAGVLRGLLETGALTNKSRALEVGCGTGNYVAALRSLLPCSCLGTDPSEEMLAQARTRADCGDIEFGQGSAEKLDFADDTFDLIFSVDVIHHLTDRAAFFQEARRVLRPGGRLCTATQNESELALRVGSHYFPDSLTAELQRYPRIDLLREELGKAGFNQLSEEHVEEASELTSAEPYRARVHSSLHFISDPALQDGLIQMEADLKSGPIRGTSRYTLLWARLSYNTY